MTIKEVKNLLTFQRQQVHEILETLDREERPVMYGFRIGEETMLDYALELLGKVEQETGKWSIKTINTYDLKYGAYGSTGYEPVYVCSACGREVESYLRLDEPIMPDDADFPRYCPWCGAKMENGDE